MSKIILTLILFPASLFLQACATTNADGIAPQSEIAFQNQSEQENKTVFANGKVNFKGVSFNYNSQIFGEVEAEEILKEMPMEDETEKPGWNFPKHIIFRFKNTNPENEAAIRILPIEDYRRMYAVSKDNIEWLDKYLKDVQGTIKNKNYRTSRNKEVPFLPYMDASQLIKVKVKHSPFKGGKGFFFLTEYSQDYGDLVTNEALSYIFQGISDDGKYYVMAWFPVTVSFLPVNWEAAHKKGFEGYIFPDNYLADKANNEKRYNQYLAKISKRLENLPPKEFNPNLQEIEEIIASLKVDR